MSPERPVSRAALGAERGQAPLAAIAALGLPNRDDGEARTRTPRS
jgi:hypothetical protein